MPNKEKETLVGGEPTGDFTKSGNPNHNNDGQFTSKDEVYTKDDLKYLDEDGMDFLSFLFEDYETGEIDYDLALKSEEIKNLIKIGKEKDKFEKEAIGEEVSLDDEWDEGDFAGLDFDSDDNLNIDGPIGGLNDEEIYEKIKEIHNNLIDGETSNILSLIDKKDKKQGLINNVLYDENKIKNASDEEIELLFLHEHLNVRQKEILNEELELEKETFNNIWKAQSVTVKDYFDKRDSIVAKREYYENEINKIKDLVLDNDSKQAYAVNYLKSKLDSLNRFEELGQKYEKLRDEYFNLKSYEGNKELKEFSEKFKNNDNPYSEERKNNAIWFNSDSKYVNAENATKHFKEETMQHFSNMTENEKDVLYTYTTGSRRYNEPLRHRNYTAGKDYNVDFVQDVVDMTNAIDKCTWKDDIWVQRFVDKNSMFLKTPGDFDGKDIYSLSDDELQALVGSTIEDTGFFSAGAGKGTGWDGSGGIPIILNTYCPRGTKMAYLNVHGHFSQSPENEMLLQRGYSYRITKVEKKMESNGKFRFYVDMEVVLGSDENKFSLEELHQIDKQYVKPNSWW